jgi:hypothetical protein
MICDPAFLGTGRARALFQNALLCPAFKSFDLDFEVVVGEFASKHIPEPPCIEDFVLRVASANNDRILVSNSDRRATRALSAPWRRRRI